jgi:hypothetical protein
VKAAAATALDGPDPAAAPSSLVRIALCSVAERDIAKLVDAVAKRVRG